MTRLRKLLAVALALSGTVALAQPPEKPKQDPPKEGEKQPERPVRGPGGEGGRGGFGGGRGGFTPSKPGTVLPPFMVEQLKLTDEQKKKLEELQKDVDKQIEKLLTEDQKKAFKEIADRGPGGGRGQGGGGERPGGGGRGPGGGR
jgi:Spy/CpxP family protein refolding chaperone